MSPKTSLRREAFRAVGGTARYVIACCSVLLALASMAIRTEGSGGAASSGLVATAQIVDRTHKGDRFPLIPASSGKAIDPAPQVNAPHTPAFRGGLPHGCEPLASSLTHSRLAEIAGRCVS